MMAPQPRRITGFTDGPATAQRARFHYLVLLPLRQQARRNDYGSEAH